MDSFLSRRHQQPQQQHQQLPTTPSPRPLQGPRPAALQVNKNSYKIRKPPAAPNPEAAAAHHPPQQGSQRQPVIIYAVSPKVIHTRPSEFMSLVQRLTGVDSSPSAAAAAAAAAASTPPSPSGFPSPGGAVSPAAKLATIERAQQQPDHSGKLRRMAGGDDIIDRYNAGGSGGGATAFAPSSFAGILSPNPASLPEISPNLFSSVPELNSSFGFPPDMMISFSPAVNNGYGRNFADNALLTSPTFGLTPTVPSPVYWDLFNL